MLFPSIEYTCIKRVAVIIVGLFSPVSGSMGDAPSTRHIEVVGEYTLGAGDPSLAIWKMPDIPAAGADEERTRHLVELGRSLFFDKRLSSNQSRSCATCHRPQLGWADGLPLAEGMSGESLTRSTSSLYNLAYGYSFFWDGRAGSLEEQALGPIFSKEEMGNDPDAAVRRLSNDAFYQGRFLELFPYEPISVGTIAKAIAAFERTIVTRNSRFDQWVAGNTLALTASEVRGFGVFLDPGRANCVVCHSAPNFTDDGFHNIGLESLNGDNPDIGRFAIKPVKVLRGAFKTPTLRNVSLSAPYFHNGSARKLGEVIDHYISVVGHKENLSPEMKQIKLKVSEKIDLIKFLNALTEIPSTDEYVFPDMAVEDR